MIESTFLLNTKRQIKCIKHDKQGIQHRQDCLFLPISTQLLEHEDKQGKKSQSEPPWLYSRRRWRSNIYQGSKLYIVKMLQVSLISYPFYLPNALSIGCLHTYSPYNLEELQQALISQQCFYIKELTRSTHNQMMLMKH